MTAGKGDGGRPRPATFRRRSEGRGAPSRHTLPLPQCTAIRLRSHTICGGAVLPVSHGSRTKKLSSYGCTAIEAKAMQMAVIICSDSVTVRGQCGQRVRQRNQKIRSCCWTPRSDNINPEGTFAAAEAGKQLAPKQVTARGQPPTAAPSCQSLSACSAGTANKMNHFTRTGCPLDRPGSRPGRIRSKGDWSAKGPVPQVRRPKQIGSWRATTRHRSRDESTHMPCTVDGSAWGA